MGCSRALGIWGDIVRGVSDVPWTEASAIGSESARETWALAARMALEETARGYHAVITSAELATYVQERSRVRTRQQPKHWLGDVLWRTMLRSQEAGEPFLAALCVDASGRVGSGYAGRVEHLRGADPGDPDVHAASERLDCYRHFGADLPDDGGSPGPMPSAAAPQRTASASGGRSTASRRTSSDAAASRRTTRTEVAPKICPTCYMALPASGLCDSCD